MSPLTDTARWRHRPRTAAHRGGGLLEGIRVLDFSAFVAGPLAAEVLADLGADVVKVEPPEGEAMRAAAYAIASCQRGKRSLALDIAAPESRPAVEKPSGGLTSCCTTSGPACERLGIDEDSVALLNPEAVYCHASAFGSTGPRAGYPGNDALMQALTGLERAVGGAGTTPSPKWIPIDMSGVAGHDRHPRRLLRARTGGGQRVATSLFGAGMLLQSGTFECDGELISQPGLDSTQTGYGPGYRVYRGGDGQWFAVVLPRRGRLGAPRSLPRGLSLSPDYTPLGRGPDDEVAARRRGGARGRRSRRYRGPRRLPGFVAWGSRGADGGDEPGRVPPSHPRRPGQPPARPGWRRTPQPTGAGSSRSARYCATGRRFAPPRARCGCPASVSTRWTCSPTSASNPERSTRC